MPSEEAALLNKLIGATRNVFGQYYVNCTLVDTLPPLTIVIEQKPFVLTGRGRFPL